MQSVFQNCVWLHFPTFVYPPELWFSTRAQLCPQGPNAPWIPDSSSQESLIFRVAQKTNSVLGMMTLLR